MPLSPVNYYHGPNGRIRGRARGGAFLRVFGGQVEPHKFRTPSSGLYTFHLVGGGGGSGYNDFNAGIQGGGGGAYVRKTLRLSAGVQVEVTVGPGGKYQLGWGPGYGGFPGQASELRVMGSFVCSAGGGIGGEFQVGAGETRPDNAANGHGEGGIAVGGDVNINGQPGQYTGPTGGGKPGIDLAFFFGFDEPMARPVQSDPNEGSDVYIKRGIYGQGGAGFTSVGFIQGAQYDDYLYPDIIVPGYPHTGAANRGYSGLCVITRK